MGFFARCYNFLLYCLLPVALLKLYWRGRSHHAYREHWGERFGYVTRNTEAPIIWVHAVSVGETIAIRPLIEALLARYPTHKIWLTNGTINGRMRTEALFGDRVLHSYAPYDIPVMIQRFIKRVKPVLALTMETEIWPNWVDTLARHAIPLVIVNGRLSERSYRGYHKVRYLFGQTFKKITLIVAQGAADAARYEQLGVPSDRVMVAGNLKFDFILPSNLSQQVNRWKNYLPKDVPIWIAGSTHDGEEEQLLIVFAALKKRFPQALWMLVPRHIERAEVIKKLCTTAGFSVQLRSALGAAPTSVINSDILLVDTIGELFLFYSLACVAFVGGSLIAHGGHNFLEPAAVGAVVTCGPSLFNFATIAEQFSQAHAFIQCQTVDELIAQTLALFEDPALRAHYQQKAFACFATQSNIVPLYLSILEKYLQ